MKNTLLTFLFFLCSFAIFGQDIFEPNDDTSNATEVTCGNFYNAFIQTVGDQDWYKIDVAEKGYLSVNVNLVPRILDLNLEIHQMVNGQLKRIADDDDDNAGGGQDLVATAFVEPGRYFVLVYDENNNSANDSESYRIEFNCFKNALEVNQTIDLATEIPRDTCFEENIWGENELFFTSNEGDNDQEWFKVNISESGNLSTCLLYTSPSPRDATLSRMPSSA